MSIQDDTAAEQRLLMELAELGMGLARQLHQVALETTQPEPLAALATAYHQVSRGVRQSIALRARFAAGTVVPERCVQPAPPAPTPQPAPRPERERTSWNEYERLDCDELLEALDAIADAPEGEPFDFDRATRVLEAAESHIRRDLTVVSRTPALAAIPALRPLARTLAGRAALLGGASLRVADSS